MYRSQLPASHPLRRLLTGVTEQAFVTRLGLGDFAIIDYIAGMLTRFLRMDAIYRLRKPSGRPIEEVAEMVMLAEELPPEGRTRREIHRHIGDFTLFWTGLFPEALQRLRSVYSKDFFVDYCEQGKRSYYIASTFDDEPYREEAAVLRRLSAMFELCAYGLSEVRKELEQTEREGLLAPVRQIIH